MILAPLVQPLRLSAGWIQRSGRNRLSLRVHANRSGFGSMGRCVAVMQVRDLIRVDSRVEIAFLDRGVRRVQALQGFLVADGADGEEEDEPVHDDCRAEADTDGWKAGNDKQMQAGEPPIH